MFLVSRRISLFVMMLVPALALSPQASAEFVVIDNFDAYTLGGLNGQSDGNGTWIADDSFVVDNGPVNAANNVMRSPGSTLADALLNDDSNLVIPDGTQATLFYRFYRGRSITDINWGLSDLADPRPESWGGWETQFRDGSGIANAKVQGGGFVDLDNIGPMPQGEWINAWEVIDNATGDTNDSRMYYLQSDGAFPTQIKLTSGGNDAFSFQNGTSDALTTFWFRDSSDEAASDPWYLDDIYLDATGVNLANPIPEPSTAILIGLGILTIIARRRRR